MRGKGVWDDPEWKRLRKRINSRTSPQPTVSTVNNRTVTDSAKARSVVKQPENDPEDIKKVNLSLNITLPKFRFNKYKKPAIAIVGVALLGAIGTGIYSAIDKPKTDDTTDVLAENIIEPEFDTVLPDGSKEATEDNKLGYDAQKKVASYRDTIDGVTITVSQQPLPEQLKSNPDEEVKKIAESFSASNVIDKSDPKAYLGNDVSGAQTVILHKNDLLIFILSSKKIDDSKWAEYISTLR